MKARLFLILMMLSVIFSMNFAMGQELNNDLPTCEQNSKQDFEKCNVVYDEPVLELDTILDSCTCQELGKDCIEPFLQWWNADFYIDNIDCEFLDKVEGSPTYGQVLDKYDQTGPNYGEYFCVSIRTEGLAASDTVENIYRLLLWQDICNELGITEFFPHDDKPFFAIEYISNQTKATTRDAAQAYAEADRDVQKAISKLTKFDLPQESELADSYPLSDEYGKSICLGGLGMILNDRCERIGNYDMETGIPIVNNKSECDRLDGTWYDDGKVCDSKYAPVEYRFQFGPESMESEIQHESTNSFSSTYPRQSSTDLPLIIIVIFGLVIGLLVYWFTWGKRK